MPRYRPAPPLLPKVEGRPIDLFAAFFRGAGRAPIVGPEGRVVSFHIRKLWAYHAFVKTFQSSGHLGRPEQRFAWIEDTLRNPCGIWRRAGNPTVEFFVSCYTVERRDFFYAVKCNVFPERDLVSRGLLIFRTRLKRLAQSLSSSTLRQIWLSRKRTDGLICFQCVLVLADPVPAVELGSQVFAIYSPN